MTFAIAVARFYEDLAERLVAGATAVFAEAGAADEAVGEVLVEARDDDGEPHRSPSPHPLPSPRRPRRCSISSSRLRVWWCRVWPMRSALARR